MPACPACQRSLDEGASRCPFDGTELSPLIGRLIGERYRVLSLLGEGAMGDVFLAEHVLLGKRMAVKVLKPAFSNSEEFVRRFQQEAIAASRIGHENIVSITDTGRTEDGLLYYVMEALAGRTLSSLVRDGQRFPVKRALPVLLQVSRALDAAHAQGIIHRDLKSENVMIVPRDDGTDGVKVLDFGISKVAAVDDPAAARITQTGVVMGTPTYMAPEQARGDAVDARADVYSFGVLAYELVTGTLPFEGGNLAKVLIKQLTETPQPPGQRCPEAQLPPALEALILAMLEKEPERRPQSMAAVRDALLAIHRGGAGAVALGPVVPIPLRDPVQPGKPVLAPTMISSKPPAPVDEASGGAGSGEPGPGGAEPGGVLTCGSGLPTATASSVAVGRPLPQAQQAQAQAQRAQAPHQQLPRAPKAPHPGRGFLRWAVLLLAIAGSAFAGWYFRAPHVSPGPMPQPMAAQTVPPPVAPKRAEPETPRYAADTLPQERTGTVRQAPPTAAPTVSPNAAATKTPAAPMPITAPAEPKPAPVKPRPARVLPHLRNQDITPAFVRAQSKLRACLTEHRKALPGKQGQLLLSFSVARSGQVRSAHLNGAFVGSPLESCIVSEVKRMRFPRHTGPDDSFDQPFRYDFKD